MCDKGPDGVRRNADCSDSVSISSASQAGTIMAAQDSFECVVRGRGGHGAMPHETVDPVIAAAMVVAALQPLVSRETDPADSAVVTVANFNSGKILSYAIHL